MTIIIVKTTAEMLLEGPTTRREIIEALYRRDDICVTPDDEAEIDYFLLCLAMDFLVSIEDYRYKLTEKGRILCQKLVAEI